MEHPSNLCNQIFAYLIWNIFTNRTRNIVTGFPRNFTTILLWKLYRSSSAYFLPTCLTLLSIDISRDLFRNTPGNIAAIFPWYISALTLWDLTRNVSSDGLALVFINKLTNLIWHLFCHISAGCLWCIVTYLSWREFGHLSCKFFTHRPLFLIAPLNGNLFTNWLLNFFHLLLLK